MVIITVKNVYSKIDGLTDIGVIDAISKALTYVLDAAKYTFQFKMGTWDGSYRLLHKNLQFATGLLNIVEATLNSYGIAYTINDTRGFIEYTPMGSTWNGHKLHDYQEKMVDKALSSKTGMIQAATGAGKSIVIGRLIYEYNLPTVIYVVSLDLLSQMHNDLSKWLGIPIGIVGDGKCDIQQITVCSAWTVGKAFLKDKKQKETLEEDVEEDKWTPSVQQAKMIKTMAEDARLVILDEAQFAAASSIRAILENSKGAVYKFGFSGTPWRGGGDDLLLEAAFGRKIVKLSASELIDKGYLVQPKIMFRDVPAYDTVLPKKWKAVHSSYVVNNFTRNDLLIRNTLKLLEMGRKPLILFREHKHGEILLNMIPDDVRVKYVTGKLGKEERDDIRDSFKAGEVDLIIASTVYDQGVDLPALDALVLAGGGKSTAKALQRIGRVIRSNPEGNKKDAIIVETFDQCHYVRAHSMSRYGIYQTEPKFLIKCGEDMGNLINKSSKWT